VAAQDHHVIETLNPLALKAGRYPPFATWDVRRRRPSTASSDEDVAQNIPFGIGGAKIPGPSIGASFRLPTKLQRVPVLDRLAVGVQLVDVDAGDARIGRIVAERLKKFTWAQT